MNPRTHVPTLALLLCLSASIGTGACASTQKNLIFEKSIEIPTGRFAGPIELELPRRSKDSLRDIEIQTELSSACGPQLRMSYPDGETGKVGSRNLNWQALLSRRAEHAEEPDPAPTNQDPTNQDPIQEAPIEVAPAGPGQVPYGHWQATAVESWPGQLEFMRHRDYRCSKIQRYRKTYTTAYDETGKLTLWADVPQEIASGTFTVRVYEVIDRDREERVARKQRAKERKEKRRLEARRNASASIEVSPRPAKPRPPKPEPKKEKHKPAKAEGATWSNGYWDWNGSRGKWVWVRGYWLAPQSAPPLKGRPDGAPPIAGCQWQDGHWVWVPGNGSWRWVEGYWNPPPPKAESPGTPPVPESPWIAGRWIRTGTSFRWSAGYWGRPEPRNETPPAPPFAGARWQPGSWLQLKGKWTWSPGYYAESMKPPPPPKRETAGTAPVPGAVWLAGFWRWTPDRGAYSWVPGHWERPPGVGYEWIPDPPDPMIGRSIGGHWKLIIDVPVRVEAKP